MKKNILLVIMLSPFTLFSAAGPLRKKRKLDTYHNLDENTQTATILEKFERALSNQSPNINRQSPNGDTALDVALNLEKQLILSGKDTFLIRSMIYSLLTNGARSHTTPKEAAVTLWDLAEAHLEFNRSASTQESLIKAAAKKKSGN